MSQTTQSRRPASAASPPAKRLIDYPRAGRGWPWKLLPSWRQLLTLVVLGVAVLVGAAVYAYNSVSIPQASQAAVAQSSQVLWSNGDLMGRLSSSTNRTDVSIADVPPVVQNAVIAAEDRGFRTNRGISVKGITRALWTNLVSDSKSQGGSTITQQFVRNYYQDVGTQKTYQRKVREAILAVKINSQLSKAQILQDYLNTIWWGRRSYGLDAAARAWFPAGHNDYRSLTVSQSAFLAAVIQAPDTFDYVGSTGKVDPAVKARAQARFDYVISGMVKAGAITQAQADAAKLPALSKRTYVNYYQGTNGYLMQYVRDELSRLGFSDEQIEGGGLRVRTTFDKAAQAAAVKAMDPNQGEYPRTNASGVHAGLASIDVKTGAVLAMYGGKDYLQRQINDAIHGRAPGSTFKPFALAAALENGDSLYSRFWGNSPLPSTGTRNEFSQSYGSQVTLLHGLEESINTVYVDATQQVGPDKVRQAVVEAGIPTDTPGLEAVPSIPLGTADVSPLEMALGYSSFAGQGVRPKTTYAVARVTRAGSTKVVYQAAPETVRAFPADVAADVTYALRRVVTNGTGTAALGVGNPVAGKTGTNGVNNDTLSAWFVGFSPRVATAVDFYRGNGLQDLDGVGGDTHAAFFGGGFPAAIWTDYMRATTHMNAYATDTQFPALACVNCDTTGRFDSTASPSPTASSSPSGSASSSPSTSPSASAGSPSPSGSSSSASSSRPSASSGKVRGTGGGRGGGTSGRTTASRAAAPAAGASGATG